jgi:hypothetical protein
MSPTREQINRDCPGIRTDAHLDSFIEKNRTLK